MENWMVQMKKADFYGIAKRFRIDPVTARIIRNRGVIGDEAINLYLNGTLSDLYSPSLMMNMAKAADILKDKIREEKKIRVIGDYDIDGIMSSYILRRGLRELGADVDLAIPDRIRDGYGINERLVREAASDGVDTIVTCDNGISAASQMTLAHTLGMTTVVTDHHEVLSLPEADAVVDPKQADDPYPYRELCGAAVAWKLILQMGGDPEMDLLQYAAFATVGDVVDLTGENRILVREGLKQLRKTDNIGLRMLAECCGIRMEDVSTYHIGFVLGPCFNASGRLSSAMRAERLLEETDPERAREAAQELFALNASRKEMTEIGAREADAYIAGHHMESDPVYVIFLPDVHESIAGIIAGRVREKYCHPVFVLTRGREGVKGSGRSIPDYSMFEELKKASDLLDKFGGHPMAAGLSLQEEKIEAFRDRLNKACTLGPKSFLPKVLIDVPMPVGYLTEELTEELSRLEPFGKENEKPLFAEKDVQLLHPRLIGKDKNVLKASVAGGARGGVPVDALAFQNAQALYDRLAQNPKVSVAYYPSVNTYMGRKSLQIVISHFQ